MPAVPAPASSTACSTILAMPCRSMSFIVKTCTPESRTAIFSRSSRLRMPTSTVCCGSTLGAKPPIRASSAGSWPSSAASGMPWTLPLNEVAGVFMSPCASSQISPIGRSLVCLAHVRGRGNRPGAEAVVAAEDDRDRPLGERRQRRLVQLLRRPRRSRGCTSCARRAASGRLRNRRRQIALVDDRVARAQRSARRARRCGTPTVPCRRRGDRRRGRAARQ